MFFFALVLFLICGYLLPWWALTVSSVLVGIRFNKWRASRVALAGGVANAALAFILDGKSHGLISLRMAALFHMPSSGWIFVLMFMIGALSSFFGYKAGSFVSPIFLRTSQVSSKA